MSAISTPLRTSPWRSAGEVSDSGFLSSGQIPPISAMSEAMVSRHPRLPHAHCGPSTSTTVCPTRQAASWSPRRSSRSRTNAAPIPSPTVRYSTPPERLSELSNCAVSVAARTSLSTYTGSPKAASSILAMGTPSHPVRLVSPSTTPSIGSTSPAVDTLFAVEFGNTLVPGSDCLARTDLNAKLVLTFFANFRVKENDMIRVARWCLDLASH